MMDDIQNLKIDTGMTCSKPNEDPSFIFNNEAGWIMRIEKTGIKFNREFFTEYTTDDFAKEFIYILEYKFNIKFYKKEV